MVWLFDDLPIPGLVPSSPVLIVGLVMFAAHRSAWSLPLVAIMVFAAMVLLTQYEQGGGIEWGGRYFALAIPIAGRSAEHTSELQSLMRISYDVSCLNTKKQHIQ